MGADGADEAQVRHVVEEAAKKFGKIDVLINNAQTSKSGTMLEDHTKEDFDLAVYSGLYATFFYMKACFPYLKETKGAIINFASGAGLFGKAGQSSYAAAKEGIRGLSRVAATEWGPHGINVNVVCPLAMTPGLEAWRGLSETVRADDSGRAAGAFRGCGEGYRQSLRIPRFGRRFLHHRRDDYTARRQWIAPVKKENKRASQKGSSFFVCLFLFLGHCVAAEALCIVRCLHNRLADGRMRVNGVREILDGAALFSSALRFRRSYRSLWGRRFARPGFCLWSSGQPA